MLAGIDPVIKAAGLNLVKGLLFSIPEAFAITALAYSLSGEKLVWWKLAVSAAVTGLIMGTVTALFQIRILPFLFHVLLYLVILATMLYVCKLASFWRVLAAVSFAIPIYLLIEFLNMGARYFCGVDINIYKESWSAKLICFLPQLFAALLLAYVFYIGKINLFVTEGKEV
ncbi:MAG: hypothetical protein PHW26_06765 [Eubacteriales bacterium]|nr:hypothetical protein [Eubacteriales bacterium]